MKLNGLYVALLVQLTSYYYFIYVYSFLILNKLAHVNIFAILKFCPPKAVEIKNENVYIRRSSQSNISTVFSEFLSRPLHHFLRH